MKVNDSIKIKPLSSIFKTTNDKLPKIDVDNKQKKLADTNPANTNEVVPTIYNNKGKTISSRIGNLIGLA